MSSDLIFGRYEILRRLAVGGMGEVFLARQTGEVGAERLVILKNMLPDLAQQDDFVEQFKDEARVAMKLNHPNIVAIYDVGPWLDTYFLVMEYIFGENLVKIPKAAAKKGITMPFSVSARILHDACLGLNHAHAAKDDTGKSLGIVHRDISPHNLMVRTDGVTKVVDFGIAKAANKVSRTSTGMLKGKFPYMSPEQVLGKELDGRSDQFSLGIVLWELLTGRRLFSAEREIEVLKKIVTQPIPLPSTMVEGLPPELEAVTMRMLSRDVKDRYSTCADAARDLRSYLEALSARGGEVEVGAFVQSVVGEELKALRESVATSSGHFRVPQGLPASEKSQQLPRSAVHPRIGTSGVASKPVETKAEPAPALAQKSRTPLLVVGGLVLLALVGVIAALLLRPAPQPVAAPTPPPAKAAPAPLPRLIARGQPDGATIRVEEPAGAKLAVDGKAWPTPIPTEVTGLEPGARKLRATLSDGRVVDLEVQLTPAPPLLSITTSPDGAEVTVAGKSVGTTPLRLDSLAFGTPHALAIAKEGFTPTTLEVSLKPGETRDLVVTLVPVPVQAPRREPVAASFGFLTINTDPWSKVTVNGQRIGTTPIAKHRLPAGKHQLVLENDDAGLRKQKTIEIRADEVTKLNLSL